VTGNLPFDEWTSVFGSERLTGALLYRVTPQVHIFEIGPGQLPTQPKQASAQRPADAAATQLRLLHPNQTFDD
jgi:hypothetical protein